MAKLAVVMTLFALLGSVACQNGWGHAPAPSPSMLGPRQNPPPSNPPRPSRPASPPRPSPNPAAAYTPSPSPLSSSPPPPVYPPNPSPPVYPPSPSPLSSTPPLMYPPPSSSPPNPPIYPPSPSPSLSSTPPPMYPPPSPSPSNPIPPTYPPNASPSPTTYSPSISPTPATSPPSSNPPVYTSPSPTTYPPSSSLTPATSSSSVNAPVNISPIPSPTTYPPSIRPTPAASPPSANAPVNISPSPTTYPPSISPTPAASPLSANSPMYTSPSPTTYPPSISLNPMPPPSRSPAASPPVYPSPSPSPSILSPYPTPSPSLSPSSSISSPSSYPPSPSPAPSRLSVGYYKYSCPNAENIVRDAVRSATDSNRGTGAGLIRLFFHDCFVEGCDASVLLNTTGSTQPTERSSAPNLSLRGFEVIDAAKASLEATCPGIVSCADIVAFAGRDATFFLSGNTVDFDMPAGRYDGRVSLDINALANLPPPFAGLQDLKDMFAAKGLDTDDMVTLSGAHTVGVSHCSSFSDRLPPNASDMNATLAASLTSQCGGGGDPTVPMDFVTRDGLDSQYYRNVLNHEVMFGSDAALLASNQTADMVRDNAFTPGLWETKFKAAMVKMGRAGIKDSTNGEIRKKCWMVNSLSN